jgi:hypothetical protein
VKISREKRIWTIVSSWPAIWFDNNMDSRRTYSVGIILVLQEVKKCSLRLSDFVEQQRVNVLIVPIHGKRI